MLYIKILDRYITIQFIKSFLFSLIGLIFVFLLINLLDAMKIETDQSKKLLYLSLLYSIPQISVFIIPAAIMFSVSFVVSQMTNDKEFIAIFSSGISFYRAISGILILSVFISFFILYIQDKIVVPFNKISQSYLNEYKKNVKKMKAPRDVIFQMNLKGKDSYYFIQYYEPSKKEILGGFHIYKFIKKNNLEIPYLIIEAESAKYNQETKKWFLKKIREIYFNENLEITKINFYLEKEYELVESIDFFENPSKNPTELSLEELRKEIDFRKKYSLDATPYEVHYHALLSFPFICIIISIIGAITGNMGGLRSGSPLIKSLLLSTLTIFLYQIIFRLGLSLGEGGVISPFIAGWGPLFLFTGIAIYLVIRHRR
ncbi:MAG: permease [Leptospiraceae bacterium]|nr:MAG: permease [Leptospiraceae bacterium]